MGKIVVANFCFCFSCITNSLTIKQHFLSRSIPVTPRAQVLLKEEHIWGKVWNEGKSFVTWDNRNKISRLLLYCLACLNYFIHILFHTLWRKLLILITLKFKALNNFLLDHVFELPLKESKPLIFSWTLRGCLGTSRCVQVQRGKIGVPEGVRFASDMREEEHELNIRVKKILVITFWQRNMLFYFLCAILHMVYHRHFFL